MTESNEQGAGDSTQGAVTAYLYRRFNEDEKFCTN